LNGIFIRSHSNFRATRFGEFIHGGLIPVSRLI
jgi:hypothetical protein